MDRFSASCMGVESKTDALLSCGTGQTDPSLCHVDLEHLVLKPEQPHTGLITRGT
jgi:hypothetical protein